TRAGAARSASSTSGSATCVPSRRARKDWRPVVSPRLGAGDVFPADERMVLLCFGSPASLPRVQPDRGWATRPGPTDADPSGDERVQRLRGGAHGSAFLS